MIKRCSECGRKLKSPESIKLGIGTICRRKLNPSSQVPKFKFKPRQNFNQIDIFRPTYSYQIIEEVIVIVDHDQGRTVTNAAEQVISEIRAEMGDKFFGNKVISRDTDTIWDGLEMDDNGNFKGFYPLRKGNLAEALAMVIAPKKPPKRVKKNKKALAGAPKTDISI